MGRNAEAGAEVVGAGGAGNHQHIYNTNNGSHNSFSSNTYNSSISVQSSFAYKNSHTGQMVYGDRNGRLGSISHPERRPETPGDLNYRWTWWSGEEQKYFYKSLRMPSNCFRVIDVFNKYDRWSQSTVPKSRLACDSCGAPMKMCGSAKACKAPRSANFYFFAILCWAVIHNRQLHTSSGCRCSSTKAVKCLSLVIFLIKGPWHVTRPVLVRSVRDRSVRPSVGLHGSAYYIQTYVFCTTYSLSIWFEQPPRVVSAQVRSLVNTLCRGVPCPGSQNLENHNLSKTNQNYQKLV